MRLADTPAPARAGGDAEAAPAGQGAAADGVGPAGGGTDFAAAVAALEAGRDAVAEVRDDLEFEDWPAPKRLAPHAIALAATAYRDGQEAGTARLMLLHDPAGQDGWTATFRVVVQVHADVEEEMAADPMLGEVGWSWLTDALDLHAPGYGAPSGTVTRVITEGYGAKADEPAVHRVRAARVLVPGGERDRGRDRRRRPRLVRPARRGGGPARPAAGNAGRSASAHGRRRQRRGTGARSRRAPESGRGPRPSREEPCRRQRKGEAGHRAAVRPAAGAEGMTTGPTAATERRARPGGHRPARAR